jgi:hypothetical protein
MSEISDQKLAKAIAELTLNLSRWVDDTSAEAEKVLRQEALRQGISLSETELEIARASARTGVATCLDKLQNALGEGFVMQLSEMVNDD